MRFLVILFVLISAPSLKAQVTTDTLAYVNDPQLISNNEMVSENPAGLQTSKGISILNYIASKFNYPDEALQEEITGTILIDFVVEKDGSVQNIEVIRKLCNVCDAEAVRVIKSTTYQVFKHNGEPQRVRYRIPIRMILE